MRRIRLSGQRFSPAMALAAAALFFSLGGVGIAATGWRITSLSQIKPSVRRALQGKRGPAGPRGISGQPGIQGPQGAAGAPGETLRPGPAGAAWGSATNLTSDDPAGSATVTCPSAEKIVLGGFLGANEIVTADSGDGPITQSGYQSTSWKVTAHLDPAATGGWIQAWAECR